MMAVAFLLAACGKSAPAPDADRTDRAISELPLRQGFYVASDTVCAAASNATLILMRRDGFNGARDSCDFTAIERMRPTSYRVTAQCADAQAQAGRSATSVIDWEIADDSTFSATGDGGPKRTFRHCEQSSLPDPWRDNDIRDLIGKPPAK